MAADGILSVNRLGKRVGMYLCTQSKPSMIRTPIFCLPWMIRTCLESLRNSCDSSRQQIFTEKKNLFYHKIILFVYSLELRYLSDSSEYTQHTIVVRMIKKKSPKKSQFASWPGVMINPQRLELSMSRIKLHGPKDVRAKVFTVLYIFTVCM